MQPQMPTEAEVISATDGLRRSKTAVDGQIAALESLAKILGRVRLIPEGCEDIEREVLDAAASFLIHHAQEMCENSHALEAQIGHNEIVLAALRSSILIPGLRSRNRNTQ